ncbi:DMT family transporter [Arcanobacterium ihumii]|uniref:DMT family transporter n=1 Tax=Arcanobacterium ihumii TaxID=2138162 RepID=UPI000F52DF8B|nr:multidrug efflux SMR transporter [Arcanobacterium ihumii]
MPWLVLILSAVCEAIWATALSFSNGLSSFAPTMVFFLALTASMLGLGYASKTISISVAYSVWVGIGSVLTMLTAFAFEQENPTALKIMFLAGIVLAVIGLKVLSVREESDKELSHSVEVGVADHFGN